MQQYGESFKAMVSVNEQEVSGLCSVLKREEEENIRMRDDAEPRKM